MTKQEVINRLKAGGDSLELSIEKWSDIHKRIHRNKKVSYLNYNRDNCALCHQYTQHFNPNVEYDCLGCPVYEYTGKIDCFDTPYQKFHQAVFNGLTKEILKYAVEELEFLKSLR